MKEFTLIITFVLIFHSGQLKYFSNYGYDETINKSEFFVAVKQTSMPNLAFVNFEHRNAFTLRHDESQPVAIVLCYNGEINVNSVLSLSFFKDLFLDLKNNIQILIENINNMMDTPSNYKMYEEDLIA